jgi:hypothetical protein
MHHGIHILEQGQDSLLIRQVGLLQLFARLRNPEVRNVRQAQHIAIRLQGAPHGLTEATCRAGHEDAVM